MDRPYVAENAGELKRLISLAERLSDNELNLPMGTDWTVSVAFAHLAFWDQRATVLLRKWKASGVEPSPIDVDVMNETLLPTWLAIPPGAATKLAVTAAKVIDSEVADCSPELASEIEEKIGKYPLYRSIHRKMHIDQIDEVIQKRRG